MGFAFVMVEKYPWRAVHLGNDNTLCAVDDKGPVWRHQRHIAHKDILLFDIFDRFGTCIFVDIKHNQAQRHFKWRAIGHVTLLTLFYIVFGLFQIIANKFQNGCFVKILNWKNRLKNAFYAFTVQRNWLIARL